MELRDNSLNIGLNLDSIPSQKKKGQTSYALNAVVNGWDGESVSYQNEQANLLCTNLPTGYSVIGRLNILARNQIVLWLAGEGSEIGIVENCIYRTYINSPCLNHSVDYPIKKAIARKSQVYYTDGNNPRRYIDLDYPPYLEIQGQDVCNNTLSSDIDCNKMSVQPNFSIPDVTAIAVESDGEVTAGTYQFAVQYSDSASNPYTSYYSPTNPISIHDAFKITQDFNYPVSKSISLHISNLDTTGIYKFVNIMVAKTINAITSFQLVGTYDITRQDINIVYTGQSIQDLATDDIFERFPIYETAADIFSVQEVLGWAILKEKERIIYQRIFVDAPAPKWQTYRVNGKDGYTNALHTANIRGHMRDESYPLEVIVEHKDGSESDRIHWPGRPALPEDRELISNLDSQFAESICEKPIQREKWQVYNTGTLTGNDLPTCLETTTTGGGITTTNTVTGKITVSCADNNCTEQGYITIKLELDKPTTSTTLFRIGNLEYYVASATSKGTGMDIFSLPGGSVPNTYYGANVNVPFEFTVPANQTTFTAPLVLWQCHSCQFPVTDVYVKAIGTQNFVLSNTQNITVHNIPILNPITNTTPETTSSVEVPCIDECYEGPYNHGTFAYWESTDPYPCDEEIWGELAGQAIRHHKFPDTLISPHFDEDGYIYPIGFKIDVQAIIDLLKNTSYLTQKQKDNIAGIKILRGNRVNNKSVIAKGLITNVLKYASNDRIITTASTVGSTKDPTTTSLDNAKSLVVRGTRRFLIDDPYTWAEGQSINEELDNLNTLGINNAQFAPRADAVDKRILDLGERHVGDDQTNGYLDAASQIIESLADISRNVIDNAASSTPDTIQNTLSTDGIFYFPNYLFNDVRAKDPFLELSPDGQKGGLVYDDSSKSRWTFHSPDTSFYQPTLGNIIKLEAIQYGKSISHIVETKRHAKYQFISSNAFITSLLAGVAIGFLSGQYGLSTSPFNGTAAFTAYNSMLSIIYKVTPHRNFAYQYNALGQYSTLQGVENNGNKQRQLDIAAYLNPGNFNVGDDHPINNYQRESSVYIRATNSLPFTQDNGVNIPEDKSKFIFPDMDFHEANISSYYSSIKRFIPNQWGQIFSYEPIDTGFHSLLSLDTTNASPSVVFGGDIFINKFAYKSKIPFFIDNRINPEGNNLYPDDSDIFYNELSNVAKVKYWFSTDATKGSIFNSVFGIKPHRFFDEKDKFFNDYGKIFLFAYGIPYFWVESEVNVDMRQATNDREGDFFPRMGNHIPDDWLQESHVTIQQDNKYNYNKTYSKQNKETFFSKLPTDYTTIRDREEIKRNTFKAIYSDKEDNQPRNNWLIYRPISQFQFPQNNGKLISIETLEDRAFLARFENLSQIYNALATIDTSTGKAAYVGNSNLFSSAPPLDFAQTDTGYNGTQHVFFLKTEFGHISVDAKRGKVFLIGGTQAKDLTDNRSGVERWFERNLPFTISKYFPTIDIDNNFKNIGLHGVFNGKRFILTKLDYEPLLPNISFNNGNFIYDGKTISLDDPYYFCNKSFSISFDFTIPAWVSYHSYVPNYYISGNGSFYSGNETGLWIHDKDITRYNNFYGEIAPYILEYPYAYSLNDEIVQSVKDYTKITKHISDVSFIVAKDIYFNKAILYNDEQCSGLLYLFPKPEKNLFEYRQFPKFFPDGKGILYSKSDNTFNYNTFWNVINDNSLPKFIEDCSIIDKELNQDNMNYINRAFMKDKLRGKDLKIRHILDNTDQYRLVSQFLLTENQQSFK